jgi:hypothetical protein
VSDPVDELDRLAAEQRDAESRHARRAARWRRRPRPTAPAGQRVSPWAQGRVAVVIMAGGVVSVVAWQLAGWRVGLPAVGAVALALALIRLDAWWWRARLPFGLEGFDFIHGTSRGSPNHHPVIEVRVQVVLVDPAGGAATVAKALGLLASQVELARRREKRFPRDAKYDWRVGADGALTGAFGYSLWGSRLFERWLRREAQLLHRAHPVRVVVVRAAFTGATYYVPSRSLA